MTFDHSLARVTVDDEIDLQILTPQDAEELFALTDRNRSYLRAWLPWLDSIRVVDDTRRFIDKITAATLNKQSLIYGIRRQDHLAGVIGHSVIDLDNRLAQIGYWLSADQQGFGIVSRACRGLLDLSFGQLGLNRIEISAALDNHRSAAIPKRLGFTLEGIRREGEWLYDRFVDLHVYSMLSATWKLRSASLRS